MKITMIDCSCASGGYLSCSAKKGTKECGIGEALRSCSRKNMRPPLCTPPAALYWQSIKMFRCSMGCSNDTGRVREVTITNAGGAKWLPALGASKKRRKRKRNDTELTTQRSMDYRPAVHALKKQKPQVAACGLCYQEKRKGKMKNWILVPI